MSDLPGKPPRRTSDIDDILAASASATVPPPTSNSDSTTSRPISRRRSTSAQRKEPAARFDSLVAAYLDSHIPPSPTDSEFRAMEKLKDSKGFSHECVCTKVITNADSLSCGICFNTIQPLFEKHRERMSLLDQMDIMRKELESEKGKMNKQVRDNQKLLVRIKELEDALDFQVDQAMTLREDMQVLSNKLVKEVENRAEIQAERDKLNDELEELSSRLFEEANEMVKDERKKNFELEQSKQTVTRQLEKTKNKLEMGKTEVISLRRKLSLVSVHARKNSNPVSMLTVDELTITSPTEDLGLKISEKPLIDTFSSIDVDLLPDRRLFEEFKSFLNKSFNVSLAKLPQTVPAFKSWIDEYVEPCARLGKLSSRKLIDAIIQNTLRIGYAKSRLDSPVDPSESVVISETSPTSGVADKGSTNGEKTTGMSNSSSLVSLRSLTSTPELARAASPVKAMWKELTGGTTSSHENLCGGCGREVQCEFTIRMLPYNNSNNSNTENHNTTHARNTQIYIDLWCRDRVYAVYEFYNFMLEQSQKKHDVESDDDLNDLFVEFLRLLKNLFYARIGVMSYFRGIEKDLENVKEIVDSDKEKIEEAVSELKSSEVVDKTNP